MVATRRGLVREVGGDGRLRTRAVLGPLARRGKVALAADGTAYVVTDTGGVTRVPATGAPTDLTLPGLDVVDVEVAPDGSLVLADGAGRRVVRRSADGATSLVAALRPPPPISRSTARRARRGRVGAACRGGPSGRHGPRRGWVLGPRPAPRGTVALVPRNTIDDVRLPSGAVAPLVVPRSWPVAQGQALEGDLLLAEGGVVRRLVDPALPPEPAPLEVTAVAGPGRVSLRWPADAGPVTVRVDRGRAPTDPADGSVVRGPELPGALDVLAVGDTGLAAGDEWTFSVLQDVPMPVDASTVATYRAAPVVVRGAALADTVAPGPPVEPVLESSRSSVGVRWLAPADDDVRWSVVQVREGTTPPASPDEGTRIATLYGHDAGSTAVPGAVPGRDYAVSVFVVDWQGNFSRWSAVGRVDDQAPPPPTDVVVTPEPRRATVTAVFPQTADFTGVSYAVAPGDAVPPEGSPFVTTEQPYVVGGLVMDTAYTLAVRSHDRNGNVSEPAVVRFRTPADHTPPGEVSALVATPGDYRVDVSWVPPTDADLASLQATLVDLTRGRQVGTTALARTARSTVFRELAGGRDYEVRVTATDVNGLTSPWRRPRHARPTTRTARRRRSTPPRWWSPRPPRRA